MIPFLAGFSTVFAILMSIALWLLPADLFAQNQQSFNMFIRGVLAPTLAAWAITEGMNLFRPLRLFDRRLRRIAPQTLTGFVAGVIAAAAGSVALALVDTPLLETLVLAGAGFLGALVVLVPLRRARAGHCIHCGYDLSAQPGPGAAGNGICPECGARSWPASAVTA
jgi:hypothetical protein